MATTVQRGKNVIVDLALSIAIFYSFVFCSMCSVPPLPWFSSRGVLNHQPVGQTWFTEPNYLVHHAARGSKNLAQEVVAALTAISLLPDFRIHAPPPPRAG